MGDAPYLHRPPRLRQHLSVFIRILITVKEIFWTNEKIKSGFEQFFKENGRYPTALEIDKSAHLPSSRQIQRRLGGLLRIRQIFGLSETNFATGPIRSKTAKNIGQRGLHLEQKIQEILIAHFGEIFVHEQKPFNNYAGRFDFFVYSKDGNFGVDVFFPSDFHSFVGCVNMKQRIYSTVLSKIEILLLQMNEDISQEVMEKFILTKKKQMPPNLKIMNLDNFLKYIKNKQPIELS